MALAFRDGAWKEGMAALPARTALGSAMIYHGIGKLRGKGPEETAGYFESVGIRPGKPWAVATGLTELASGVLALAGMGTRLAALGVLITQGMAIRKVHFARGYPSTKGGFEYNVALMAIALGLLIGGPGKISGRRFLARRMMRRRRFPWVRAKVPLALELLQ